jgi:iron(II)-dependent oxidoreductase
LSEQTGRSYRLPTEAEWEKAASWTGEQKRRYPWGDKFDPSKANTKESGLGDTTPVGHYSSQGDSPAGCADMVGNVQEWSSTLWGSDLKETLFPYPYQAQDGREDLVATHLHRVYRVHRGGSFRDAQAKVHCSARGCSDPDSKIRWRGFRVVLDV